MKLMANLAAISIVVSHPVLAGIEIGTPLVSGDVVTFKDRHETGREELSQAQLQALSGWLAQHRSGWRGMITEATNEPRSLQFSLRDAGGKGGAIEVIARAGGGHYLRFVSSSEKWSYRSLGGLFKSRAATHEVSPEEFAQLRRVAAGL